MDVLLVLTTSKLRAAAAFALETTYGAKVSQSKTIEEALATILNDKKPDLLIVEHPYSAERILELLTDNKLDIPIIVYLALEKLNLEKLKAPRLLGFISGTEIIPTLLQITAPLTGQGGFTQPETSESMFFRIHSELIEGQRELPCDIFTVEKNKSFSIVFKKGDAYSESVLLRKIKGEKPEYFFVIKEDADLLLGLVTASLDKALSSPNFNPHIADQVAIRTQEMTAQLIKRVGLTPEVLAMVRKNVTLTIQSIGSRSSLKSLMTRILLDRKKYISSHSVSLAQICCAISAGIGWDSEFTYQKLVMASFFHDITNEDQDLAMVQTKDELYKMKDTLGDDLIKEYLLHPLKAAEMVRKSSDCPPDVDIIIVQHHERPDGSGFPRGLSNKQIAPLAAIFIVAHDLVSAMYEHSEAFDMDQFLSARESIYISGNFKKAFNALKGVGASDNPTEQETKKA